MTKRTTMILVLAALALSACNATRGSGDLVTQSYELDGFTEVDVASSFDATVTIGPEFLVEVTADDNVIDLVEIDVDDAVLRLRLADSSLFNATLKARVQVPVLEALTIGGSSDVGVVGDGLDGLELDVGGSSSLTMNLNGERIVASIGGSSDVSVRGDFADMSVDVGGSSDVTMVGDYSSLVLDIGGSSDVTMSGAAERLRLDAGGSSDVRLDALMVDEAAVSLEGSSTARLTGAAAVSGSIEGSSDLHVAESADVRVSTSGSSDVHRN